MSSRKLKKLLKRLKNLPGGKYFFLYAFNKLRHFLYKLTKSTKVAYPSTVMIELTNHCNLHCITCAREYAYGKEMDKGYIQKAQAFKIIDELWPYLDSVGLTGMGETFMYKEIEEIVDYIHAKNKGIIISLSTNAMLPNFIEKVKSLINKVDTIQVSIDGLNEVYNQIRKNADFNVLDKNLKELSAICKNTQTNLMLNVVVTKENYKQMSELVEFAKHINVQYINFNLFNLATVTKIETDYYKFYQSREFIAEFEKLEKMKENSNIEITNWDLYSENSFQKCPFPWTHFYISWDGYVVPCCTKPFPKELHFGNVFDNQVIKILNSQDFMKFRTLWYKNISPEFCKKCQFIDLMPVAD